MFSTAAYGEFTGIGVRPTDYLDGESTYDWLLAWGRNVIEMPLLRPQSHTDIVGLLTPRVF